MMQGERSTYNSARYIRASYTGIGRQAGAWQACKQVFSGMWIYIVMQIALTVTETRRVHHWRHHNNAIQTHRSVAVLVVNYESPISVRHVASSPAYPRTHFESSFPKASL